MANYFRALVLYNCVEDMDHESVMKLVSLICTPTKKYQKYFSSTLVAQFFYSPLKQMSNTVYILFLMEFLTRFVLQCTVIFSHLTLKVLLVKQIAEF